MRFALLFALLLGGAQEEKASPPKVLAEMEGYALTEEKLEEIIDVLAPSARQRLENPERRREFVRNWMEVLVLAREADAKQLDREEAFQRQMELRRSQALADYYREQAVREVSVDEEDMRKFYEENMSYFSHPKMVKLSQILVAGEEEARQLRAKLSEGADFAETARKHSKDLRTRERGGLMGWIQPGQMEASIEQTAFALEPGQISEPLRTVQGWHILTVTEARDAGHLTIDDIRGTLQQQLLQQKRKQAAERLVEEAAEKYRLRLYLEQGREAEEGQKPPSAKQDNR